jgi:hypothetical protein
MKGNHLYLRQLLAEERRLREEVRERNSALFDQEDISLDDALTERKIIDHLEEELELLEEKILQQADLGFFGYTQPGGLNTLFYGYDTTSRTHPSRGQT